MAHGGDAVDADRQRSLAQRERLGSCELRGLDVGVGQSDVDLRQHLCEGPVVVHRALDGLEVAAHNPSGVGEEVGHDDCLAGEESRLGLRRRRIGGSLDDEADRGVHAADVVVAELVLECSGNQDVDGLLEPCLAGEDLVARALRGVPVDAAKRVRQPSKLAELDPVVAAKGDRVARLLVPGRNAAHRATDLGVELDRTLGDVPEALDARRGVARVDPELPQRFAEGVDQAVAGRPPSPFRPTGVDRFAGDRVGPVAARDRLVLVEHPCHVLPVGHQVGRRDLAFGADQPRHAAHPHPA